MTGKSYLPEGEVTVKHTEYALAARFVGPSGNHIVILTPGARNSGMLLTVRTFTTPGGLAGPGKDGCARFEIHCPTRSKRSCRSHRSGRPTWPRKCSTCTSCLTPLKGLKQ